jgi:calcineurin-like phosphoesterase family protein
LGHANILNFKGVDGVTPIRPFSSLEEMNETIIENWNKTVNDNDTVYHLGDVYFGQGWKHVSRLKGKKHLVVGNHDNLTDNWEFFAKNFKTINVWRVLKSLDCVLTHVPIHECSIYNVSKNIHGHIHEKPAPTDKHINVCAEWTNYTPVAIEEIMK